MPSASTTTTVAVKPGLRLSPRTAWRTSRPSSSSQRQPQTSRVRSRISVPLPSLRRAARTASACGTPASRCRSRSSSRWRRNSSWRSASAWRRPRYGTTLYSHNGHFTAPPRSLPRFGRPHDAPDRLDHPLPLRRFPHELAAARLGEGVELRPPIDVRATPRAGDPAPLDQPVEGRVERSWSTCRTSLEVRSMVVAIWWPCAGPCRSVWRMSMSRVPCSNPSWSSLRGGRAT